MIKQKLVLIEEYFTENGTEQTIDVEAQTTKAEKSWNIKISYEFYHIDSINTRL